MAKTFGYTSYSFIDKDPIIDYVRTVVTDSGKYVGDIAKESGVAEATIRGWLYGDTKRPQAATINAVLMACGHKLIVADSKQKSEIEPTASDEKVISMMRIRKYRNAKKNKAPTPVSYIHR